MSAVESIPTEASTQDALYQEIALSYGAALERLARAYEADRESCRDLLQEIHIALWRISFTHGARLELCRLRWRLIIVWSSTEKSWNGNAILCAASGRGPCCQWFPE